MATRVKTVQYFSSTVITTLASATLRTLTGATSLYIPEANSGAAFSWISCNLEVTVAGDNAAAASLTAPTIGIGFTGTATDSVVLSAPIGNSTENESWCFQRDVTAYFTTNWTVGTTSKANWYVNVTTTGLATCNHCAKLTLTYQYDDTKTTQLKTIWIPIESTRTNLTTTAQTVGGATAIPANLLRTYLPETGITVRQSWIELWGNEMTASTGVFTMQARIGGGTYLNMWRSVSSLNSARWAYCGYDITTYPQLSASTALALECIVLTTTARMSQIGGLIGVTYEFNSTGSTSIYNSLLLGGIEQTGWIGGTTLADSDTWSRNIYIEEPDTITMKESAVMIQCQDTGGFTMTLSVSGQTEQAKVFTAGTIQCGIYSAIHRIDSGGLAGNGITLSRGKNVYTLLIRSGTANAGWNVNAMLILNYISGKHGDGVGAHSHSCHKIVFGNTTVGSITTNTITSATITPTLPETNYNLIGMLLQSTYTSGAIVYGGVSISHEIKPGEGVNEGWTALYGGMYRQDGENSNGILFCAARNNYKRWNGDPDSDRVDIKTTRKFRYDMVQGLYTNLAYWYTYNTITYVVSGTCTGFSGDGSGIPVDIFRVVDSLQDEKILELTTTTGGIFTGVWVDNTDTLYAAARQDDTHVGRSTNGSAG
jgi:hypothetical protein